MCVIITDFSQIFFLDILNCEDANIVKIHNFLPDAERRDSDYKEKIFAKIEWKDTILSDRSTMTMVA